MVGSIHFYFAFLTSDIALGILDEYSKTNTDATKYQKSRQLLLLFGSRHHQWCLYHRYPHQLPNVAGDVVWEDLKSPLTAA
jgi:hypothetical protein